MIANFIFWLLQKGHDFITCPKQRRKFSNANVTIKVEKRRFYQHREIKFHLELVLKSTLIAVNRPCSRAFHGRTRFSLITILRISGKFHYFSGGKRVQCCDSVDVCHTVSNAQTKTDCVATRQNRTEREHRPKSRINAGLFFLFCASEQLDYLPGKSVIRLWASSCVDGTLVPSSVERVVNWIWLMD